MPFIKCRFCGKQFSDKLSICPFCKKEPMVQPALQTLPTTSQQTAQKSAKRYVNPIIVVSVIIALAISFIGYKFYLNIEKRRAEIAKEKQKLHAEIAKEKQKLQADREFSALVVAISGKMIKLAIDSENVVDEINRAWHEAIFSKYKKRDFNDAIIEVHRERSSEISSIRKLSESIASDIKIMNPPEGKEKDYQRLKELYLLFNKYANMALSPSGSLQTYSQQNSQLKVEIKSAIKELELMR